MKKFLFAVILLIGLAFVAGIKPNKAEAVDYGEGVVTFINNGSASITVNYYWTSGTTGPAFGGPSVPVPANGSKIVADVDPSGRASSYTLHWSTICSDPQVSGVLSGVQKDEPPDRFFIYTAPDQNVTCPLPSNLNAWCSSGQFNFTWSAGPTATNYAIRIRKPSDPIGVEEVSSTIGNVTSYNYTPQQLGVTYSWWLHGINAYGWSSPAVNGPNVSCPAPTPTPIPPPLEPINLQNPQACQPDNSVTANLSWSTSTGATGYKVYEWTGAWQLLSDRGNTLSYPWPGRVQGNFYRWGVSAYNSSGATDPSLAQQAFTAIPCPPRIVCLNQPDCPPPTTCDNKDGTPAVITWNRPTGATSFQLRVDDQANGWIGDANANGTCNDDPKNAGDICIDNYWAGNSTNPITYNMTIIPGHNYHWWIHACGAGGCSAQSNGPNFTGAYPAKSSSCPVPTPLPGSPGGKYGDVDGDLYVSCRDANTILEKVAGQTSFSTSQIEKGDVSDTVPGRQSVSTDVNSSDATYVLQYLSGSLTSLPVCNPSITPPPVCTDPDHTPVGSCDGNTPPKGCFVANTDTQPNCDGSKGNPICPCPVGQVCKTDGTGTCGTPTPTPTTAPPGNYTISGNVFLDNGAGVHANNGVKDLDESNYTASTPTIKIGATNPTSNSGGAYTFSGLAGSAGGINYNVALTPPSGYTISNGGLNPNTNPRGVTITTADATNVNFGIIASSSPIITPTPTPNPVWTLSGTVFIDTNGDGIRNIGEQAYTGTGLNISDQYPTGLASPPNPGSCTVSVSNAQNNYVLRYLYGSYIVGTLDCSTNPHFAQKAYTHTVTVTAVPTGYRITAPSGGSTTFTVTASTNVVTVDIGLEPASTLTGNVFIDDGTGGGTRSDGIKNGGEVGYPNPVTIYGFPSLSPATTSTLWWNTGYFSFNNFFYPPSTAYTIGYNVPANYYPTNGASNLPLNVGQPSTTNYGMLGSRNRIRAAKLKTITSAQAGVVSQGSADIEGYLNAGTVFMVVYQDNAGSPGNLLAASNGVLIPTTWQNWVNFTFPTPFNITAGQTLWLGIYSYVSGSALSDGLGPRLGYEVFSSNFGDYAPTNYIYANYLNPSPPSTFPSPATSGSQYAWDAYLISKTNLQYMTATLPPDATVNFGIALSPTISGLVYLDNDDDGVYDPFDPRTGLGVDTLWTGTAPAITAGTATATFTGSSSYTISNLAAISSYDVQLATPLEYIVSHGGLNPNTNPRTVSVLRSDVSRVNFGLRAAGNYTIGGSCLVDNPPYATYGGNDTGLPGSHTIAYSAVNGTLSGTATCSNGNYPPISVPAGEYDISYQGSPPAGYATSFPPNLIDRVIVGPFCDPEGSATFGASCVTSGSTPPIGSIIGLNFGFKPPDQWIQSSGTDIRFDNGGGELSIPDSAAAGGSGTTSPSGTGPGTSSSGGNNGSGIGNSTCNVSGGTSGSNYTSTNGGIGGTGSPGIIYTGARAPDFGTGGFASSANWKVGTSNDPDFYTPSKGIYTTSYAYVSGRVKQGGITPTALPCTLTSCTLPALSSGVYTADSSVRIEGPDYTLPASRKVIILVKGNLTIATKIFVPKTSTLTFIVSGDIHIDESVGTAWNSAATQVEGFYSADGSFYIDGKQNDCVIPDNRLNMAGSIIVNAGGTCGQPGGTCGQFVDNRTLCTNNSYCPVFTISERPDFVLNAPESIKQIKTIYQEVAP